MWLLIDDQRNLNCQVTARTAKTGKACLALLDNITTLCLDHDLGEEETGYDVCKWACENGFMPDHVQIVTSNPVGRENIARCLEAHGYTSKDNNNYYKGAK